MGAEGVSALRISAVCSFDDGESHVGGAYFADVHAGGDGTHDGANTPHAGDVASESALECIQMRTLVR